MKYTIKNDELAELSGVALPAFPKYTSQLINWANQNAQGTRPRVVGQMSELFSEYLEETNTVSPESWKEWYLIRHPHAIDAAADKIWGQIENLKNAISLIDREMVLRWVEDLVLTKTYTGLYVQKSILAKLAKEHNTTFRLATPDEEAKGIDGYVGGVAYSIKPDSYRIMRRLSETIDVKMIYYSKKKSALIIDVEDEL